MLRTSISVVTSIANVDTFSLLIASGNDTSTLIKNKEAKQEHFAFEDLNSEGNQAEIDRMQSLGPTFIRQKGGDLFFKAQKLEVSGKGKSIMRNYIRENFPESMRMHEDNILRFASTQALPSNEIYPANVHDLFHFRETNMDDLLFFLGEV